MHFPDGEEWLPKNGDSIKEFNPNLPDFETSQQMNWKDLT